MRVPGGTSPPPKRGKRPRAPGRPEGGPLVQCGCPSSANLAAVFGRFEECAGGAGRPRSVEASRLRSSLLDPESH
eukprot:7465344-Alexandrium_andersonii.AAC.1